MSGSVKSIEFKDFSNNDKETLSDTLEERKVNRKWRVNPIRILISVSVVFIFVCLYDTCDIFSLIRVEIADIGSGKITGIKEVLAGTSFFIGCFGICPCFFGGYTSVGMCKTNQQGERNHSR